jgi:hypothetical protein
LKEKLYRFGEQHCPSLGHCQAQQKNCENKKGPFTQAFLTARLSSTDAVRKHLKKNPLFPGG